MKRIRSNRLRARIMYIVAAFYVSFLGAPLPAVIYAQEAVQLQEPPCVASAEIPRPTGSSGHTYAWDCNLNLWVNPYFTWNPYTYITTPKYTPEHTFNETTGMWEVREWRYVASSGTFEYRVTSTYAPAPQILSTPTPAEATISNTGPESTNTISNTDGTIDNTGPNSTNSITGDGTLGTGSILTTGPYSQNSIDLLSDGSVKSNANLSLSVDNQLDSSAVSGDANVLQNTTGGNATTGDALAMANILNMLQSTWGLLGNTPELYTADIQGDYFGDIMIDPSLLSGGASNNDCGCGDLKVNASLDATINNDINLLAQSGDASVSKNTTGGDAATGDATALANIVNMISSSITSGESFLGVLNIHGDLNGDVLVAQDVIDELLAANVPTAEVTTCNCGDLLAEFTDTQTINNSLATTASSGEASVGYNTAAGNATSGNAETSVTVFNVTGRHIIGQNALLVFVNVMGEWIGFLVDAPSGSTAAMYGGDISQNTAQLPAGDTEYNINTDAVINNNIQVAAHTGDAEVSYNTRGGNATSGDAYAGANVSNIMNSNFSLAGWFGLLFINILGDWFGSFGENTSFGNLAELPASTNAFEKNNIANQSTGTVYGARAMGKTQAPQRAPKQNVRIFQAAVESDKDGTVVLASVTEATPPTSQNGAFANASINPTFRDVYIGWALMVAGVSLLVYFYRTRMSSIRPR